MKANAVQSPKSSPKSQSVNQHSSSSTVNQSNSSLQSFNSLQQSSNSISSNSIQFQSTNSLSSLQPAPATQPLQNHSIFTSAPADSLTHDSKIAWKIRDPKKKRQKHITLGLTREEFAHIQESLRHRPVKCKSWFHQLIGIFNMIILPSTKGETKFVI